MDFPERHAWGLDARAARELQETLASEVDTSTRLPGCSTVAAADVSFSKYDPWLYATVIVVRSGTSEVVETAGVVSRATFPYVPGLLSFRELPAVLEAFRKLQTRPDVVLVDGQGTAHPRRLGIACHLGLWLQVPTVGCAKSRLCGEYDEPGPEKGDRSPLTDRGEVVGAVLRSRSRVKPLFVSPGHLCDQEGANRVVMENLTKYRLPVPARLAHAEVNRLRREAQQRGGTPGSRAIGLEPFLPLE